MIKVLFEGLHDDHHGENHYVINPLTSSSTLIRTKKHNILIDSGAYFHHQKPLDALAEENVKPTEIDYVLNTHYHLDHTTNNFLFPNALVGVGQNLLSQKTGEAYIYGSGRNPHFPDEIEDLLTPGHSEPHHSYIYREGGVIYVMAGDAVFEPRLREGVIQAPDKEAFYKSMMKIFEIADVLVPGHGRVLRGGDLKELHEIVKGLKV